MEWTSSGRRILDRFLSFGEYAGEPETDRAKRRIMVGSWWFGALGIALDATFKYLDGYSLLAAVGAAEVTAGLLAIVAIHRWPLRLTSIVTAVLAVYATANGLEAVMRGGLLGSGLSAMWGIIGFLAALIAISRRAAAFWVGVFVAETIFATWIPTWIDPIYPNADPIGDIVFTLLAMGGLTFAVVTYFVRQRDRFQEQSDRLLRNVLPEEIAVRLKLESAEIADYYEEASVLFADVVGFTPMSAGLSPRRLVSLLGSVFTDLDGFVGAAGLEKIKTVGDEYMVASGVPSSRPDHVEAIADLALRIRDHTNTTTYEGHKLQFRIGIHTGPLIAGVIGQRKFAYDLWGDTVNTASRLESHGIPGEIQISADVYEALKDSFVCEPRGLIEVKGKGRLEAWLLQSRNGMPVMSREDP
ncbi:MAG: adenylate/guanylate cyclase domain-containing protein [Acidimicrobiia bacterium]|nr:adenylate/guanylate cyclase domain-containing protein [Acidimicrobiia bacterium]